MSKKPSLIAVPNAAAGTAGHIVYWRLSGGLDLANLGAAWRAQGLDPAMLPEEPSATVALRRAVSTLKRSDRTIEATKEGLVVLDKTADVEKLSKRLVASLDLVDRIRVTYAKDPDEAIAVSLAFTAALTQLAQADVSPWLSDVMADLRAVPLRDTGGVYFVPRSATERFNRVLTALRGSTAHVIAAIPALDSDEAVAAVLDALQTEANKELETIRREMETEDLGERALNTRIEKTEAVEGKLAAYENLLGGNLDAVRDRLQAMRAELTVAMTKAQAAAEKSA